MTKFAESTVEEAVLEWADGLAYTVLHGPEIAPGESAGERDAFVDVLLVRRLRDAIERINPQIPAEARDEAYRRVLRTETPNLLENNRRFHRMLVDGIDVEYQDDGRIVHDKVWLIDFGDPDNNDWLAVNQFSISEGKHTRRPDVIMFVNGLPLVVIELKNAADENATTKKAFDQLQTYKLQLPTLMTYNVCLAASDGITARIGTLTAGWDRFMPWRTTDGREIASKEVLRKLLSDEIKARSRKNLVQSRSFAEMLEKTIKKYQNRSIDAAQVITALVELAKEMRQARKRGEALGLTEDEEAFYEALEVNDSAVAVLGDKALCAIARELVDTVRRNVTIDWTVKDSARAKLRLMVKKILKRHGYPPDKQAQATETVLKQAELLCADWAA